MYNAIVVSATLCLIGSSALAQELPEPRVVPLGQGLVCETPEQVENVLSRVATKQEPYIVKGCFMLRTVILVKATPLYWYETSEGKGIIAQYTAPNGDNRFGLLEFVKNPEPEGEPA